jgi:hypothetical protein
MKDGGENWMRDVGNEWVIRTGEKRIVCAGVCGMSSVQGGVRGGAGLELPCQNERS